MNVTDTLKTQGWRDSVLERPVSSVYAEPPRVASGPGARDASAQSGPHPDLAHQRLQLLTRSLPLPVVRDANGYFNLLALGVLQALWLSSKEVAQCHWAYAEKP